MAGHSEDGDRQLDEALEQIKAGIDEIPLSDKVRQLSVRLAEVLPPRTGMRDAPQDDETPDMPPGPPTGAAGQSGHA